jgi:nitrogen regulatory protein PII
MMKKIEAIVPSSEMQTTFDALEKMGINFSYCDIKGRGQECGDASSSISASSCLEASILLQL